VQSGSGIYAQGKGGYMTRSAAEADAFTLEKGSRKKHQTQKMNKDREHK
jgi:hypothetical protein